MKIVYFSDSHLTFKRPGKRLDETFYQRQLTKLEEVVTCCISNAVDFVIHGGDLFDTPKPEYGLLNDVMAKLRKLKKANIPLYITLGSHDIFGYNIESLNDTAVGTLLKAGLLKRLIGLVDIKGVPFYGVPALFNHKVESYAEAPQNAIIITHNMLVPSAVPYEHVLWTSLPEDRANFYLLAHYHKVFSLQKRGNNSFVSTGPLVRTSVVEASHQPNILLLDIGASIDVQRITITHEPNVFDLTQDTTETPKFIESLHSTQFDFYDLFDLTRQIATQTNVAEPVLQEALTRLQNAQAGLNNE